MVNIRVSHRETRRHNEAKRTLESEKEEKEANNKERERGRDEEEGEKESIKRLFVMDG